MTRVKMWYDKPMPKDCGVTPAEWDWHCYRTKGREPDLGPDRKEQRREMIRERARVVVSGREKV